MRLKFVFEMMELDDQKIAIPVSENTTEFKGVIKLNETAAFIFKLLKNETSEAEIIDAVSNEYAAPRDIVADDVHRYLKEFQEKGLLV